MVGAHSDPAGVGGEAVDPVGVGLARLSVDEVVDLDLVGFAGGALFPPAVLVLPDEFFFRVFRHECG